MKRVGLALILALAACATSPAPSIAPAGHQPGEEAAILDVVDRFMQAISGSDMEALAALQMSDGMTYVARPVEGGGTTIVARPNSYWVDPANADDRIYRERYWSPTVLIRGDIALVFTPYEFWIDGETSHCGVDTFDLVRTEGHWRIANAMWTVERTACGSLRPADPSAVRPAG